MWASLFVQGSFNLLNFDRNWYLIDIDFYKPGVVLGLSLNCNLYLELFSEVHKYQVQPHTFQGKFYRVFRYFV